MGASQHGLGVEPLICIKRCRVENERGWCRRSKGDCFSFGCEVATSNALSRGQLIRKSAQIRFNGIDYRRDNEPGLVPSFREDRCGHIVVICSQRVGYLRPAHPLQIRGFPTCVARSQKITFMNRPKTNLRVAIYARVSTLDKSQDPRTQLRPLREYAARRGFDVADEFVDRASGRGDDRTNYQKLRDAVRRRAVDVVLVWRYDRFARSTHALITALSEFSSLGVDFISLQEGIDTTTPQGRLVFTIMAGLAEFESSLIGDRVRAGMARARADGKHIGRRPLDQNTVARIVSLRRRGKSVSFIQEELAVARGAVVKYAKGIVPIQ